MTAYIIFQESIFDQSAFEEYKKLSPKSIDAFGGRFIVRGGKIDVLEGAMPHERVVIIAFPTADAARAWHSSDDYAAAKSLRQRISDGDAILVEGI
ncbi:DUF1330 domain-containing protein [Roseovarius sp. EL26]|uniref:DUF1330 domain-containing protein n=1 Tax=Roseovarius sp. EL26 TaxID=2126672 RepID=UPI000EA2D6B3|nr:DUF1330 domain-containing protein [Roseovarius sp. EL26]